MADRVGVRLAGGRGRKIEEGLNRGKEERGGYKVLAVRSVGANFHFFRLSAPLLGTVRKKHHGGTTFPLVDFGWISSFIGLPPLGTRLVLPLLLSTRVSICAPLLPLFSICLSPSLSFSLVTVLLFPFHSPGILSLPLFPAAVGPPPLPSAVLLFLSLSTISRRSPSSNPRHFWARQESLCN